MLQVRPSPTLDGGDFGWLKARHHFAKTPDGNPANGPLGAVVVWNDHQIGPGTGFGLHARVAPARGVVEVNGHRLAVGVGIAATDERRLTMLAEEDCALTLVETV